MEEEAKFNNGDIEGEAIEENNSVDTKTEKEKAREVEQLKDLVFHHLLVDGPSDIKKLYELLSESQQQIKIELEGYKDERLIRAITSLKDQEGVIVIKNKIIYPTKATYRSSLE